MLICLFGIANLSASLRILQEEDSSLYRAALEILRTKIRSSTASLTSVPKPLKFLRPQYGTLKEIHAKMPDGENKVDCKAYKIQISENGDNDQDVWNGGGIYLLILVVQRHICPRLFQFCLITSPLMNWLPLVSIFYSLLFTLIYCRSFVLMLSQCLA